MNRKWQIRLTNAALYGLTGVMMWLCLQPLVSLTILNVPLFPAFYSATMMLLFFLNIPAWVCSAACGLMLLYAAHFYFFDQEPLFAPGWLAEMFRRVAESMIQLWRGEAIDQIDLFSAVLFFVFIGLATFVIRFWLRRGRVLPIAVLAIFICAVVDTFTNYDGSRTVMMLAAAALLLLSINSWQRASVEAGILANGKNRFLYFSIVALVITVILLTAVGMPRPAGQWSAASEYLSGAGSRWFQNGSLDPGMQRIGYDDDDSRLGGSLSMDRTPVFTAAVSGDPGYWRVASKDHYTGRGWSSSKRSFLPLSGARLPASALTLYDHGVRTVGRVAVLRFAADSPAILPYSGQPEQVTAAGKRLKIDRATGQLMTADGMRASSERLIYAEPIYQKAVLQKTAGDRDPAAVRDRYLQLPQHLPDRVRALGKRLAAGGTNRYDRVQAVVAYLRSARFRYTTDQVARPSRDQDYVDQFLFETKAGYCDNFSTALVVLLRSAGIPARWVKGFTSGEFQGRTQEAVNGKKVDLDKYQITNADAHSWAEVYFPGSGWVSFEPTPSFDEPEHDESAAPSADRSSTAKTESSQEPAASSAPVNRQPSAKQSSRASGEQDARTFKQPDSGMTEKKDDGAAKTAKIKRSVIDWSFISRWVLFFLAAVLLAAIVTRKNWLRLFYIRRIEHSHPDNAKVFQRDYRMLLRLLALAGLKRPQAETLREFAMRVDSRMNGSAMLWLTEQYERMLYGEADEWRRRDAETARKLFRKIARADSKKEAAFRGK